VAVLGSGTMGHGIAQVAPLRVTGCSSTTRPLRPLDQGLARIRENLEKGVELGKVSPEARDLTLARILTSASLEEAVSEATIVIEAAPRSSN
jgi:3-hydroxybutyryl-CoA dehydrogenase